MVVGAVAAVGRGVNGDVGDHAAIDEFVFDEFADELDVLLVGQFVGQGQFDVAGELGRAALGAPVLAVLDPVPKALTVPHPLRGVLGGEYLCIQDGPGAPRIVLDLAGALVVQCLAGPVGCGGDSGLTLGPGDDGGGEAVIRHGSPAPALCAARPRHGITGR